MEHTISILNLSKDDLLDLVTEAVQSVRNHEPQPEEKKLLSRKETAALLGINLATLHRWTVAEKLNAKGIGGRVYYDREEVLNSVKSLK